MTRLQRQHHNVLIVSGGPEPTRNLRVILVRVVEPVSVDETVGSRSDRDIAIGRRVWAHRPLAYLHRVGGDREGNRVNKLGALSGDEVPPVCSFDLELPSKSSRPRHAFLNGSRWSEAKKRCAR